MRQVVVIVVLLSAATLGSPIPLTLEASSDGGATWAPKGTLSLATQKFTSDAGAAWSPASVQSLAAQPSYMVRAYLGDSSNSVMMSVPRCALVASKFRERIGVLLTEDGDAVQGLQWQSAMGDSHGCSFPSTTPSATKLAVNIIASTKSNAVPPHAQAHLVQQQRQKATEAAEGGPADQKGFIAKYWHYILIFMVGWTIVQVMLNPPPEGGAAAAPAS